MSTYDDMRKLRNGYPASLKPEFDARLAAYVAEKDAEIARLRAALEPFADFAKAYGPVASTLDYPESHVLMQVGIPPEAVVIRLQDFYAALKALGEES